MKPQPAPHPMTPPRPILLALLLPALAHAATPDPQAALAVLASDAGAREKSVACQQLAVTGGPAAVPALAGLLADEHLSDYARTALEAIPDAAAGQALRNALPQLAGRLLAGAVNSLGARREAAAVPELTALARDPARGAAEPALAALGRIANDEALATLRATLLDGPAELRAPAAHAALAAAQQLTRDGRADAARALLEAVAAAPGLPDHVRAAATHAATPDAGAARPLFDGRSFDGWEGDPAWFRIAEGAVVAGSMEKPVPSNLFLCTTRQFSDFELQLKVRLVQGKGNGGIQLRSHRLPDSTAVAGYQADVADGYWGGIYDEGRRGRFLGQAPDPARLAAIVKPDGWNDYRIRCEGPRIRLWLNGHLTADFTETDAAIPRTGVIALQAHAGPPSEVWYKDLRIQELLAP